EQTVFSQMRNVTVGSAEEFRVKPPNEDLLKQIAKRTGGIYQPKPEELLLAGGRSGTQIIPLWQWLLAAAMVLFTADVFLRRVWGHLRYA
ncbi:MAG: hypothetical protein LBH00_12990, partial [Planctomycetaceae bacterium]|nr:hypothetical protein [Planctomycetaceae bacterium]